MRTWYGLSAAWWVPLERDARRAFGTDLHVNLRYRELIYVLEGLRVPTAPNRHALSITFLADAEPGATFGLPPQDFPRVHVDGPRQSKHRHGDGSLCLWMPTDPAERRWTSGDGLLTLIELARRHIIAEYHWRATRREPNDGVWLLDEAPHGFPEPAASSTTEPGSAA